MEINAINQSFLCDFQSVFLKRIKFEYQADAKMLSPVEMLTYFILCQVCIIVNLVEVFKELKISKLT